MSIRPRRQAETDRQTEPTSQGFWEDRVSPACPQGQGGASPYLLRLSLKRLEVVGDILQLLLQLRTLTVNSLRNAGQEKGRRGEKKKKGERHADVN